MANKAETEEEELRRKALAWEKKRLLEKIRFLYQEIGEQAVVLIEKQEVCIEDKLRDSINKIFELEKRLRNMKI